MGAARDLRAVRKDGSELPVEVGLTPLGETGGGFVIASIGDLTERKRVEAMLRDMNAELERRVVARTAELEAANEALRRSNYELEQFASVAAHELRAPLRAVTGLVDLLEAHYGDKLGPEAHEWIRCTVESTTRMRTMVRDLLSYARSDAETEVGVETSLSEVVDEAIALLEVPIRESGAQITRDELPSVTVSRSQLSQVMLNLLDNALKYSGPRPPRIHVSAARAEDGWTISVTDNGIGIDPSQRERVFELFFRLQPNSEQPGSGIGLAVCQRVIRRHGGRIWVESTPGDGSIFRFTLP